jgi:cytoplasmic iron level regulating protein YaaA (DUF328/UPF0246 family)
MKIILSPAKRLNEKLANNSVKTTIPVFLDESEQLIKILQKQTKQDILELMKLSSSLAELNYNRYKTWKKENHKNARAAVFMFEGEAYRGLNVTSFNTQELKILNQKLFILSGLYGVLKPLDSILPYRLEMGIKLNNPKGKNLYDFWKTKLTTYINAELKNEQIINLASKEYASVIDFKQLKKPIIQIDFLQEKENKYKNIAIYSKRARGMMTAFIVKNEIEKQEDLRAFDLEGYYFNNKLSKENHLIFTR